MIHLPTLLIVEDEPLIAADIEEFCAEKGYSTTGIAYNQEEAIYFLNHKKVDFVLLDIRLGKQDDGLAIGKLLCEEYFIPFIYITSFYDTQTLEKAKKTQPVGYLIKPFRPQDIDVQIKIGMNIHQRISSANMPSFGKVNKNNIYKLSEREYALVVEICKGKSNIEIADGLHISMNTVKTHLKNIFIKLNTKSRSELIYKILMIGEG
jgi:DNA-binding NarL/FixJ family response regulator